MQNAKSNNRVADFARKESEYKDKIAEYRERIKNIIDENNILKQEIEKINKSKTLIKKKRSKGE